MSYEVDKEVKSLEMSTAEKHAEEWSSRMNAEPIDVMVNTIPKTRGCKTFILTGTPSVSKGFGNYYKDLKPADGSDMLLTVVVHKSYPVSGPIHYKIALTTGTVIFAHVEDGRYCWVDGYNDLNHLLHYWDVSLFGRRVLVEKNGHL